MSFSSVQFVIAGQFFSNNPFDLIIITEIRTNLNTWRIHVKYRELAEVTSNLFKEFAFIPNYKFFDLLDLVEYKTFKICISNIQLLFDKISSRPDILGNLQVNKLFKIEYCNEVYKFTLPSLVSDNSLEISNTYVKHFEYIEEYNLCICISELLIDIIEENDWMLINASRDTNYLTLNTIKKEFELETKFLTRFQFIISAILISNDELILGLESGKIMKFPLMKLRNNEILTKDNSHFQAFSSVILGLYEIKKEIILGISIDFFLRIFKINEKTILGGGSVKKLLNNSLITCSGYISGNILVANTSGYIYSFKIEKNYEIIPLNYINISSKRISHLLANPENIIAATNDYIFYFEGTLKEESKYVFEFKDLIEYNHENIKTEKLVISSLIFFESDKMLISCFKNGKIIIWNTTSKQIVCALNLLKTGIYFARRSKSYVILSSNNSNLKALKFNFENFINMGKNEFEENKQNKKVKKNMATQKIQEIQEINATEEKNEIEEVKI